MSIKEYKNVSVNRKLGVLLTRLRSYFALILLGRAT
jgi:hypothetical protein